MRFQRLLHVALALATLLAAPLAQAQTVEGTPKAQWVNRAAGAETALDLINRADCLDEDAELTFDVDVSGSTMSQTFEVWAGSGCNTKAARDMETSCMRVSDMLTAVNGGTKVSLKVKDLVQEIKEDSTVGTGSEDDCTSTVEGSTSRTLFFLLINSSDREPAGTFGQWQFKFDMSPPGAPTGVVASPGEESIQLDFTAPSEQATTYRFYCSEVGPAADNLECGSTVLIPGEAPPAANACGESNATGSASGTAEGNLSNGITYAVAVTAVDEVGNVSLLSNISCATPVDVTGWFEAYRAAGGQAGGGFCSFAPARHAAVPLGLALLLASATLLRRRR